MWKRPRREIVEPATFFGPGRVMQLADLEQVNDAMEDGNDADDEKEEEAHFEQCGLPTRMKEREELGEPQRQSECYGCIYMGERETGAAHEEDLAALMDMAVQCIGQTDPICLVNEIAQRYAHIRGQINANLLQHERPLPPWTASTIMDHFRSHHCDPEFMLWLSLRDTREAKEVSLNAMIEENTRTKKQRINKDAVRAYVELTKLEWQLAKTDPSKCTFYNPGTHLDTKGVSSGPLALNFKPTVALLKRGNLR